MVVTRARVLCCVIALALWAGHLALVSYFVSPALVLADRPIDGADFDTHIGQTYRVVEGLARWGKPWVYDVQLLAGQPEGTIFDADNKAWELWTFLGSQAGLSKAHAFNAFVLMAHAVVPVIAAAAAAVFGLSAGVCLVAGAMASTLWFFDSWAHWTWWIGMVAYALASVSFLLPLALFHRFASSRSRMAGVTFVPVLALCHLLHPYSFFMLALPLAAMYLNARRSLTRGDHALVMTAVVATCALNAFWILPALQHWHYILDSGFFGRTGVLQLCADFFDLLLDPSDSGVIGTRAGFRFLYLGMAVAALIGAFRARDSRMLGLAVALVNLIVLAYLGSYLPGGNQIQPYRHVLPLGFLACLLAALFVQQLVQTQTPLFAAPAGRALAIVAMVGTTQHLVSNVLYFTPDLLPRVHRMIDGTASPFTALGQPPFPSYRIPREIDSWIRLHEMSDWIVAHVPKGDRVLIEETHLGEHVAWKTGVEVLGGFRQRNIAHSRANFFRTYEKQPIPANLLAVYLATYAVRWVITVEKRPDFERAADLLEPLGSVEGRFVYRSRIRYEKALSAGGSVQASTNLIEVKGSAPSEPLVLSYHYHERLRCRPSCTLVREPVAFDDVGLIRVPAPHPADLKITLDY